MPPARVVGRLRVDDAEAEKPRLRGRCFPQCIPRRQLRKVEMARQARSGVVLYPRMNPRALAASASRKLRDSSRSTVTPLCPSLFRVELDRLYQVGDATAVVTRV